MAESAFIVRVPEAEPCVGALRERFDASVKLGVPAHITVLVPFMSPERITEAVRTFPEHPPFGGEHESIIPHLTVAHGSATEAEAAAGKLAATMQTHGPITSSCAW